jgi:hypothetical protein
MKGHASEGALASKPRSHTDVSKTTRKLLTLNGRGAALPACGLHLGISGIEVVFSDLLAGLDSLTECIKPSTPSDGFAGDEAIHGFPHEIGDVRVALGGDMRKRTRGANYPSALSTATIP